MLDIAFIREHTEEVRKNLARRMDDTVNTRFDELLAKDKKWRALKTEMDELVHQKNVITARINELVKAKKDPTKERAKLKDLPARVKGIEATTAALRQEIDNLLLRIPNMLHESVPIGANEGYNVEVKKWGKIPKKTFALKTHAEIMENLGLTNFNRSRKIAGRGFYFLTGNLALMNQALIRFAIDHLVKKGFTYCEPPLMMNRKAYSGVTDLGDFENVMFKIEGEDRYMIATSEHPMVAQFMDETIDEKDLPIKLAGYSMCFRKEIGTHNVDERGIFRTHQFNKVEQVILCKPEDSWKIHEELLKNTEEIFQALEIPYHVVNICTGDIGIIASKKYDIEAWMANQGKYREVASCSHCTDFQARRLGIKCGKEGGTKRVLHTLNNTAIATGRAMVAILENNQNADGSVTVPKVLWPYMTGIKKIEPGK